MDKAEYAFEQSNADELLSTLRQFLNVRSDRLTDFELEKVRDAWNELDERIFDGRPWPRSWSKHGFPGMSSS